MCFEPTKEEVARSPERPPAVGVGGEVEVGAERTRHQPDQLLHRRMAQVAEAQVEDARASST